MAYDGTQIARVNSALRFDKSGKKDFGYENMLLREELHKACKFNTELKHFIKELLYFYYPSSNPELHKRAKELTSRTS